MKNNIRIIRAKEHISQEKLAIMSGVSRVTISEVENEKVTPNTKTILKIAEALNKPVQAVFLDFVLCENTNIPEK